jgi:hypothetical protein
MTSGLVLLNEHLHCYSFVFLINMSIHVKISLINEGILKAVGDLEEIFCDEILQG